MENRLLTIVFIDVQGFTRRTASQTREETETFVRETREFVTEHLEKWHGRLVKAMGDGFLAAFDSPTNAAQCGLEMQRRLVARNANILNPDHFVRFRIGINTGEVSIDENGDLFGDPVNIAARIESFAEPNEVFISESTYLAMNRNEFGAQDLGPQTFKNATREIRVYKLTDPGLATTGSSGPTPATDGSSGATGRSSPVGARPVGRPVPKNPATPSPAAVAGGTGTGAGSRRWVIIAVSLLAVGGVLLAVRAAFLAGRRVGPPPPGWSGGWTAADPAGGPPPHLPSGAPGGYPAPPPGHHPAPPGGFHPSPDGMPPSPDGFHPPPEFFTGEGEPHIESLPPFGTPVSPRDFRQNLPPVLLLGVVNELIRDAPGTALDHLGRWVVEQERAGCELMPNAWLVMARLAIEFRDEDRLRDSLERARASAKTPEEIALVKRYAERFARRVERPLPPLRQVLRNRFGAPGPRSRPPPEGRSPGDPRPPGNWLPGEGSLARPPRAEPNPGDRLDRRGGPAPGPAGREPRPPTPGQ